MFYTITKKIFCASPIRVPSVNEPQEEPNFTSKTLKPRFKVFLYCRKSLLQRPGRLLDYPRGSDVSISCAG
jgi:hypothetical protein